jgi:hypothetical protein
MKAVQTIARGEDCLISSMMPRIFSLNSLGRSAGKPRHSAPFRMTGTHKQLSSMAWAQNRLADEPTTDEKSALIPGCPLHKIKSKRSLSKSATPSEYEDTNLQLHPWTSRRRRRGPKSISLLPINNTLGTFTWHLPPSLVTRLRVAGPLRASGMI